ncbi:uncharacterized protein LOC143169687 [Aptenodytes patagonicus]|uniref:uncharacterized protein LOC143169687 n=1 Tax=Aptenodytes patagonicus TaxID=9234 RepID=UPI003FA1884B
MQHPPASLADRFPARSGRRSSARVRGQGLPRHGYRPPQCHLLRHTKKILRGRFHLLLRMSTATVVALSSAIKVQDRWKGSIVVCKYKAFPRSISSLVTSDGES